MLTSTCHCGAVQVTVPRQPLQLTNCNCSICRRVGALWAYYQVSEVQITGHPARTAEYIWGDKTLRVVRCRHCGCVTHWEALQPGPDSHMGVNARLFDPEQIGPATIRCFDGAASWKYLD